MPFHGSWPMRTACALRQFGATIEMLWIPRKTTSPNISQIMTVLLDGAGRRSVGTSGVRVKRRDPRWSLREHRDLSGDVAKGGGLEALAHGLGQVDLRLPEHGVQELTASRIELRLGHGRRAELPPHAIGICAVHRPALTEHGKVDVDESCRIARQGALRMMTGRQQNQASHRLSLLRRRIAMRRH